MVELNPCPFCGGEARMRGGPAAQELYSIWCTGPGCNSRMNGTMDAGETADKWNRRPQSYAEIAKLTSRAAQIASDAAGARNGAARNLARAEAAESALASERAAHAETNKLLAGVRDDAMRADNELCAMDARIAELEAENERLRNMLNGYGKLDAELAIAERRIEDLSRTGAVKVKPLDLSNLLRHAFFEGFMVAGGSQEAAAEWWPEYDPETCAAYSRILSALELAAPESQQPVARPYAYEFGRSNGDGTYSVFIERSLPAKPHPDWPVKPLYTHPAEQAVTEAMVEAAVQAVRQYTRDTLFIDEHRELVRAALKAAMEAGG